jgi:CRISPR-associated endonuclease/helicase Cas3
MSTEEAQRLFADAYKALTGCSPLRWQRRLFSDCFFRNDIPAICDLPTGMGKTSVIPIWMIALAAQAHLQIGPLLPRRLIYIVNRRTVVDQATVICESIRTKIISSDLSPDLHWMRAALQGLRANPNGPLIAISTLRGEFADNQEWKADPTRPAIIVGTVDMIGSKLLFSGYGDSYKSRPHHAGLIGQDALFVHDEAHLTPAFSELLRSVVAEQIRCREPRPIKMLELSATNRSANLGATFSLTDADSSDDIVKQRLLARKCLYIHKTEKANCQATIVELALVHKDTQSKVLIYVTAPKDAQQIVEKLKKELGADSNNRVSLLTGTMRGYERDRLVRENPVYLSLLDSSSKPEQALFLVSTSAGEVGIDLDADHLVCDLSTLDSMAQRFGRVNRRGGTNRSAQIDIVTLQANNDKEAKGDVLDRTLVALQDLPKLGDDCFDAAPQHFRDLLTKHPDARSAAPKLVPVDEIAFDAWSLTSGRNRLPNTPDIHTCLHGIQETGLCPSRIEAKGVIKAGKGIWR